VDPELSVKRRLTIGDHCVIRIGGETFPVSALANVLRAAVPPAEAEPPVVVPFLQVEEPPPLPAIAKPTGPPKPKPPKIQLIREDCTKKVEPATFVVKWPFTDPPEDDPIPDDPPEDERTNVVEDATLKQLGIVGPVARTLAENDLTTRRAIIGYGDLSPLLGHVVAAEIGSIVSDWTP